MTEGYDPYGYDMYGYDMYGYDMYGYDPYMMGGMYGYDPYMMGGYDPYFAGFGDPYNMYFDPYNMMGNMYYDPYMAGGMYYDPWMDDGETDSTYMGYSSYAAWCAATNCNYRIYPGEPVWETPEGSLGYSAQQAFFPGSDVYYSLSAWGYNPGNLRYEVTSGSLPPGLSLFSDISEIRGIITPADDLDTITFDGNTATFNLTKTAAPLVLDTVAFDGSTTYDLTKAGAPNTLDPIMGKTGFVNSFNLYDEAMPFTPVNDDYLTVTINGVTQTLDSDYTVSGAQIYFTNAPYPADMVQITYTDRVAYTPAEAADLTVVIDGVTQDPSTYTITGSQIEFNAAKQAAFTDTLDTITFQDGVATYNLTKTGATTTIDAITFDGSADSLNTIISNGTDTFSLTKDQTGATTTLDGISWAFNSMTTDFPLRQSMASYTPADPNNLTVTFNGSLQTLNSDYTISDDEITFYAAPYPGDTVSMEYTTIVQVNVTPTAAEILEVTVDGTPVPSSDYTVSGDEIIFNETIAASSQIDINHITGSTTYDLTTAGTPETLDPIGGFTGGIYRFFLRNAAMPFTPGVDSYLTVTQNGSPLTLDTDYTIDGAQIVFTNAPLMGDSVNITYTCLLYTSPSPRDRG